MEKEIKKNILEIIEDKALSNSDIRELIIEKVFTYNEKQPISFKERSQIIEKIYNSICSYDILTPLLKDESVNEIMVNGHQSIFYEQKGVLLKFDAAFESEERLMHIIQTMVGKVNRVVNESTPIVDARLHDGSRINVVLPPASLMGPILTIRKFSKDFLKARDLVYSDTITEEGLELLKHLVACKYNIFISGGTSSGKTTFLNLLGTFIPSKERVITIEDSAELKIKGLENLISMESRNNNIEGKGGISIADLIKTSLRMRPDRIIVGEVRGGEAFHMLTAMNTGHEGALSTGHANSGRDMLMRLTTMILTGNTLSETVAVTLIRNTLDIVVHLGRWGGKRKVLSIAEIKKHNKGLELHTIFERDSLGKLKKVGDLRQRDKIRLYGGLDDQEYFS